jgi:NAD(P)H-dependent FMN reductase
MEKIVVVSGSHRKNSESERVAQYICANLKSLGATANLLSLAENPLPLWDEKVWQGTEDWKRVWGPVSVTLEEGSGLVIVSPEWAGMVPPGLKNFLLLCGNREVAHKPTMIVGVSSGIGGSYPIAELRSSSYKNNRLLYVPDHVIVRQAPEMLHGESPANERDAGLRSRITYSLRMLLAYAAACRTVRDSGIPDYKTFPFGM